MQYKRPTLRAALKAAGITQKELARKSGVHAVTISRCVTGKKWPAHLSQRNALLRALGMTEEIPGQVRPVPADQDAIQ